MKYFDKFRLCVVFIQNKATREYWEKHWERFNLREVIAAGKNDRFILNTTQKYIKNGRILEGGCGTGAKVFCLQYHGYDAYGVDFAISTVKKINEAVPDLKVLPADVRHLPFRSSTFDGYWSLGVIEHFFTGYGPIADEMRRVLKPGGFLFLTFPYMSPLRKLKAKTGQYCPWDDSIGTQAFYQFALDKEEVIRDFEKRGFLFIKAKPYDSIKGCKDEIQIVKPFFQYFYDYSGNNIIILKAIHIINRLLEPFASHMILLVLKKIE